MKENPDNQINASFIDISRIKWLVFSLRSSFFRLLSTGTRSNRQHTGETSKTMDINPSLQILGWYIKGTGRG